MGEKFPKSEIIAGSSIVWQLASGTRGIKSAGCVDREGAKAFDPPEPGQQILGAFRGTPLRAAAKEHLGDTHYENGRALPAVSRSDRVSFCRRWSYLYAA